MENPPAAPDTTPDDAPYPLLAYLDELINQLRTHVIKALNEWDEQGIHQSRVATRRLKAALDLYKPVLSKGVRKPFGDELRKLRRRLGPLRDADVMLGHVAEFGGDDNRLAPAVAWATESLLRERDEARARSLKKASPPKVLSKLGRWWGIREQFAEAREAVDILLAESLHAQVDAFTEQAEFLIARHRQRPDAGDPPTRRSHDPEAPAPIDPHELRIIGKSLRYTLEMAARQGHELPKSIGKSFKQMQEHLGLWHDYVVLADRLLSEAVSIRLGHYDAPLKDRVLDLSKASLHRATRELNRFYRLWTDRGEAIVRGIRDAFPIGRQENPATDSGRVPPGFNEPRTDPGLDGSAGPTGPAPAPPAAPEVA